MLSGGVYVRAREGLNASLGVRATYRVLADFHLPLTVLLPWRHLAGSGKERALRVLFPLEPLLAPYPAMSAKSNEVVALCLDADLRAGEYSLQEHADITGSIDVMIVELAALMRKEARHPRA